MQATVTNDVVNIYICWTMWYKTKEIFEKETETKIQSIFSSRKTKIILSINDNTLLFIYCTQPGTIVCEYNKK